MEDTAALGTTRTLAESESQRCDPIFSPPHWMVPAITRVHVWLYEKTNGRVGPAAGGMRHIILKTVGRRSGRVVTACLPYWLDRQRRRVLVASDAGAARHPAWYHNARDRRANPLVHIQDGRSVFSALVEVLEPAERNQVWSELVADRPFYGRYQARTQRRIPLIRILEQRA